MKPNHSKIENRVYRVGGILKSFFENNQVYTASLSEKNQVNIRTVQRDLDMLKKIGFPIHEIKKGCYCLDKNLFKNFELFDESELSLILTVQHIISQLGPAFEKAGSSVFNRLFHAMADQTSPPVFIKLDEPILIENRLFKKVTQAIKEKKTVSFDYSVYSTYAVDLEPYKIAYYEGVWYLIGKEMNNDLIKAYAFDKIKNFKVLKTAYRSLPNDLEEMLNNSANVWFSGKRSIHVEILVAETCVQHFKRRKIFPTQEINNENEDGSMVVSFAVSNFDEIRHILKKWLPYIKILKPDEFKNDFVNEIKNWVEWQERI